MRFDFPRITCAEITRNHASLPTANPSCLNTYPPGTRGKDFDIFQPFPLLPLELRISIWTATLSGPQVHCPSDQDSFDLRFPSDRIASDPVALWIARESRAVALRHYRIRDLEHLRWYRKHDKKKFHHAAYVNYSIDQSVFSSRIQFSLQIGQKAADMFECYSRFMAKSELPLVRNIHIFSGDFENARSQLGEWLEAWLDVLSGLETFAFSLTLVRQNLMVEEDGIEVHLWGGVRWVVTGKEVEYRQALLDEMEKYRAKRLVEGAVWKVPVCKFEFVRAETDEVTDRFFYQF